MYAQRWLTFEDPCDRLQKLRTLTAREIKKQSIKERERAGSGPSPASIERQARSRFGLDDFHGKESVRLLSALIALAEIERFASITFDAWLNQLAPGCPGGGRTGQTSFAGSRIALAMETFGYEQKEIDYAMAFAGTLAEAGFAPTHAQCLWVINAWLNAPDWSRLSTPGPWRGDERAHFIVELLSQLQTLGQGAGTTGNAWLVFQKALDRWRKRLSGNFLPAAVLIVEGPTEKLLIPYFAMRMGLDLDSCGVMLVPAGGSNQVARRYLALKDLLAIPVMLILDGDAQAQAQTLSDGLRDEDRLFVIAGGEIEDLFDAETMARLLNEHLRGGNYTRSIQAADLCGRGRRTAVLNRLFRERGLGDFDKIGFARTIVENPSRRVEVPAEARRMVQSIKELLDSRTRRGGHV